jgi:hypothetical protein
LKNDIDETASEIDMRTVHYLVANCRHNKGVYEEIYYRNDEMKKAAMGGGL